jgi:hypothetical protein
LRTHQGISQWIHAISLRPTSLDQLNIMRLQSVETAILSNVQLAARLSRRAQIPTTSRCADMGRSNTRKCATLLN